MPVRTAGPISDILCVSSTNHFYSLPPPMKAIDPERIAHLAQSLTGDIFDSSNKESALFFLVFFFYEFPLTFYILSFAESTQLFNSNVASAARLVVRPRNAEDVSK